MDAAAAVAAIEANAAAAAVAAMAAVAAAAMDGRGRTELEVSNGSKCTHEPDHIGAYDPA